jgi:hypothetical protein
VDSSVKKKLDDVDDLAEVMMDGMKVAGMRSALALATKEKIMWSDVSSFSSFVESFVLLLTNEDFTYIQYSSMDLITKGSKMTGIYLTSIFENVNWNNLLERDSVWQRFGFAGAENARERVESLAKVSFSNLLLSE